MGDIKAVYEYAVVVKTDDRDMALAFGVFIETEPMRESNGWRAKHTPVIEALGVDAMLSMRQAVWKLGELLLLDANGREVVFPMRKPDKWHVEVETFDLIDDAIARALEVTEESRG